MMMLCALMLTGVGAIENLQEMASLDPTSAGAFEKLVALEERADAGIAWLVHLQKAALLEKEGKTLEAHAIYEQLLRGSSQVELEKVSCGHVSLADYLRDKLRAVGP